MKTNEKVIAKNVLICCLFALLLSYFLPNNAYSYRIEWGSPESSSRLIGSNDSARGIEQHKINGGLASPNTIFLDMTLEVLATGGSTGGLYERVYFDNIRRDFTIRRTDPFERMITQVGLGTRFRGNITALPDWGEIPSGNFAMADHAAIVSSLNPFFPSPGLRNDFEKFYDSFRVSQGELNFYDEPLFNSAFLAVDIPYSLSISNVAQARAQWDGNTFRSIQNILRTDATVLILPTHPVPEPGTMLLFGTGLVGLAVARFRKKV